MALDALTVKGSKPKEKSYRLYDTNGLYLEITPKGSKLWRLKYRYAGKEKRLSFGAFPNITLKQARLLKDDAKNQLAKDIYPGELKKQQKQSKLADAKNSFEAVTWEWIYNNRNKWSKSNTTHVKSRFTRWDNEEPRVDEHVPRTDNRCGFRKTEVMYKHGSDELTETIYYVLPESFRSEICKGLNFKAVIKLLRELGAVEYSKDNKSSIPYRLPGYGKKKQRCYKVIPSNLNSDRKESQADVETCNNTSNTI